MTCKPICEEGLVLVQGDFAVSIKLSKKQVWSFEYKKGAVLLRRGNVIISTTPEYMQKHFRTIRGGMKMSVTILGLDMPANGYVCVTINSDGTVIKTREKRGFVVFSGMEELVGAAVDLPVPHGRLIDCDAFIEECDGMENSGFTLKEMVMDAPIIIEAEEC